jgi:hypothetical protein
MRLSALCPPRRFLVFISVRGWVDPRAIVRLEELGQLKNPMISSGFAPATFWLVAQCLNKLRYRVPLAVTVFKSRTANGACITRGRLEMYKDRGGKFQGKGVACETLEWVEGFANSHVGGLMVGYREHYGGTFGCQWSINTAKTLGQGSRFPVGIRNRQLRIQRKKLSIVRYAPT